MLTLTRDMFERKVAIDLEALPKTNIEASRTSYTPQESELGQLEASIREWHKDPNVPIHFLGSYYLDWVRLLRTNEELDFTGRLRSAVHEVIDDLFKFVGSPHLTKPAYDLIAPTRISEFEFARAGSVQVHFVPDLGIVKEVKYKLGTDSTIRLMTAEGHSIEGSSRLPYVITNQGEVVFEYRPLFIKTCSGVRNLVDAIASELMHYLMKPYFARQASQEIKKSGINKENSSIVMNRYIALEEIFVHAITSVLWVPDFGARTGILTETELETPEAFKEFPRYKGSVPLSGYMKKGLQSSIEFGVNDLPGLMKAAGIEIKR